MDRSMIVQDGLIIDRARERMSDLRGVADHCKGMQNAGMTGSKDNRLLAVIPAIVIEQYCNDSGVTFAEFMQNPAHANRMLNDPALADFRVSRGRV